MARSSTVITVTLNTAIDRVLQAPGFKVGAHQVAEPLSLTPAGKGINLSRALARLGRTNVATGFVGKAEADRFERLLRCGEGLGRVNNQLLSVAGPTRENITVIDPDAATDTHLRTRGYVLDATDVGRMSTKIGLLSREDTVVVFAGSTPEGADAKTVAQLAEVAQTGDAQVVLDLDGPLLSGVVAELEQPIWMISPNRKELASAIGHAQQDELGVQELLQAVRGMTDRCGWVLVSLGADGGLLVTEQGAWRGKCEFDPGRVASTVGGGDCLVAAAIDARLKGLDPENVLRRSLAVATASTLHLNPAEFELAEVQSLMESAEIEAL